MRVVQMVYRGSDHADDDRGGRCKKLSFLATCVECGTRHTSMETAYVVL